VLRIEGKAEILHSSSDYPGRARRLSRQIIIVASSVMMSMVEAMMGSSISNDDAMPNVSVSVKSQSHIFSMLSDQELW